MKPLLTVPVQSSDISAISKLFKQKLSGVGAIEVWLDALKKADQTPDRVEELCRIWTKVRQKKLVVVCKDPREKGKFKGTAAEKAELLLAAARGGANYIDFGLHTPKAALERVVREKKRSRLIISHHDFDKTPTTTRLRTLASRIQERGADIIKIATMIQKPIEAERLMEFALELQEQRQPHVILGMGKLGMITRVFAKQLGNELNFVSLATRTAPGQLSLEQMLQFQAVLGNS